MTIAEHAYENAIDKSASMSRVTSGGVTSNVNQVRQLVDLKARMKRKKRKKDLEQLRRNVLAAKQTQVSAN